MCPLMRMRKSSGLQMRMNEGIEGAGYYSSLSHMSMYCLFGSFLSLLFYYPSTKLHVLVHSLLFSAFLRNQAVLRRGREGVYFDVLLTLHKLHDSTPHRGLWR
jgi:hypothetical protein